MAKEVINMMVDIEVDRVVDNVHNVHWTWMGDLHGSFGLRVQSLVHIYIWQILKYILIFVEFEAGLIALV